MWLEAVNMDINNMRYILAGTLRYKEDSCKYYFGPDEEENIIRKIREQLHRFVDKKIKIVIYEE